MQLFGNAGPARVTVADNELRCSICGSFLFWERSAQMNTAVAAFFGLSWANRSATCYVCDLCGHVLWFLEQP